MAAKLVLLGFCLEQGQQDLSGQAGGLVGGGARLEGLAKPRARLALGPVWVDENCSEFGLRIGIP